MMFQDTSGGVEMKEKITTYRVQTWSVFSDGEPLSANLNRIIDAIERTPMEKFDNASSDINLGEMSEKQLIQYLDKNPQSLVKYSPPHTTVDDYSIFTNFVL